MLTKIKNIIQNIYFFGLMATANLIAYKYYWPLKKEELLSLSWFHEVFILLLWVYSLILIITSVFAFKNKIWLTSIISFILGISLLIATSPAMMTFRNP
jgi:hypothetical protein